MKELKPEVPILIFSAAMERPEGLEFADGFLAKGVPPDIQLNTIAHLLARGLDEDSSGQDSVPVPVR